MAGHRPFGELTQDWKPERLERVKKQASEELAAFELAELREKAKVTQQQLAKKMKITQVAVSRLERRPNIQIRKLRQYVRAIGGKLEIRAIFPDGIVTLTHLGEQ